MVDDSAFSIRLREGFRDQILYVIPRPVLERNAGHPLLHSLMLTDIGWYPQARYHYCERAEGAPEHILILCVADHPDNVLVAWIAATSRTGKEKP